MRSPIILLIAACLIIPFSVLAQDEAAEAAEPEEELNELVAAIKEGNVRDLRTLLDDGADADTETDAGTPVLIYSSIHGLENIATALIEAGADVEAKDIPSATALMYAAQFDHDAIVTALIEAGADVNAADSLGWTPLIRAVIGNNIEAVTALMAAGADVNATDFLGRGAVRIAEGRDLGDIVAVLNGTVPETGS